jgi:hypothetical protein
LLCWISIKTPQQHSAPGFVRFPCKNTQHLYRCFWWISLLSRVHLLSLSTRMDTIQGCSLGPTQVLSYQAPASKLNNNVQKIYTELLLSPQSLLILYFILPTNIILYYIFSCGGNARDAVTGFDRFMIENMILVIRRRVIRRLAFHSW